MHDLCGLRLLDVVLACGFRAEVAHFIQNPFYSRTFFAGCSSVYNVVQLTTRL